MLTVGEDFLKKYFFKIIQRCSNKYRHTVRVFVAGLDILGIFTEFGVLDDEIAHIAYILYFACKVCCARINVCGVTDKLDESIHELREVFKLLRHRDTAFILVEVVINQ